MKKPVPITINLIPKDPFFITPAGKVLRWALSAGRYIVIFTELVVIASFITRFTLDRKVTDLNSLIEQRRQIILSYGDLEENFRSAQEKVEQYQQTNQEGNITDVFTTLTQAMPPEIVLERLSIYPDIVNIEGLTNSQTAFNLLINNLQLSPQFTAVTVSSIESKAGSEGMTFRITVNTKAAAKPGLIKQ